MLAIIMNTKTTKMKTYVYYNRTAATTSTKILGIAITKVTKTVMLMLKTSKITISKPTITSGPTIKAATKTLYDQLINIITKIRNCYYYNDLFYMCNIKKLINIYKRRHKYSKKNKIRNTHREPKPKYLTNTIRNVYYNKFNNNENNHKQNCIYSKKVSENNSNIYNDPGSNGSNVENMCYCEHSHGHRYSNRNFKKKIEFSYKITDYMHNFCYFQKNYHSLRLLLLIFLLTILTTTAHNIEHTEEKPQRKSNQTTNMPPKPLTRPLSSSALSAPQPILSTLSLASLDVPGDTFKTLTDAIHMPCYQNNIIPTASLNLRFNQYHNFKSRICYIRRHLLHINSKFKNLKRPSIQNDQYMNKAQINYQHHDVNSKVAKFENILENNNSSNINNNNNTNFNQEEEEEEYKDINNLIISKFLKHIQLNDKNYILSNDKTIDKNMILTNYTILTNFKNNDPQVKPGVKKEDTNKTNDNVSVDDNHYNNDDNFEYVDDKDEKNDILEEKGKLFNLLPTITAATSSSLTSIIYADPRIQLKEEEEQYIDHQGLMKLVMDGLDLKKIPDMKNVNISQKEYATKYREYLERVHAKQKRHLKEELYDYDESVFRPLQFFTIISNSSLLGHQQYGPYNEHGPLRQKRHSMEPDENERSKEHDERFNENGNYTNKNLERSQTLQQRVKNILFLRKKHQKPRSTKQQRGERKTNIRLMFAFKPDILNLSSSDIEEANTRLVLIHSPILAIRNSIYKKTNVKKNKKLCSSRTNTNEGRKGKRQMSVLNLKIYFIPKVGKRILLDGQKINIHSDHTKPDETHTQWLQFDVTKAVKFALDDKRLQHVAFELQCDKCKRVGARVFYDAYNTAEDAQADDTSSEGYQLMPVLNIIGRFEQSQRSLRPHKNKSYWNDDNAYEEATTTQRHYHLQNYNKSRHNHRTNCYKSNQRCCRHSMEVTFKKIKGFEFIIQPKIFDAGYCQGRCPPRYNPAHHHAMLQSLIWKQNHYKTPRPCCAPSKLVELEVLHVDEKDSEKLKISTWSDMKVVECACS